MPTTSSTKTPGRANGRAADQVRPIRFEADVARNALASVLCSFGNTEVICAVTLEENVPKWMQDQNKPGGWITAEYSMLPYATHTRKPRDASRGKVDGRSTEIQRLIGRSLRAVCDLEALGPRSLWIDCDVLRADGGTRTAAITGAALALEIARRRLEKQLGQHLAFLRARAAAVSVGIVRGCALLDLDYNEDSAAEVDMNIVMTQQGQYIELQGSGEESTFSKNQLATMLRLAAKGCAHISAAQENFLKKLSRKRSTLTKS